MEVERRFCGRRGLAGGPAPVADPFRLAQAVILKGWDFSADFSPPEEDWNKAATGPEHGSTMNKLIFANLIHRPLRSIISVLAVAIEVVMILSIVGIFMGMLNDQKQRTNGIGADMVVSPSNASFMNGMSGAAMSAKLAPFLATLPHVAVAAPVIQNFSMGDSLDILYGVDFASFNLPWGRRYALLVVLGYSRLIWLKFFSRQSMQCLSSRWRRHMKPSRRRRR